MLGLFAPIIAAAVLGGAGCALAGYYLSNLRLPFMGVCLSHAAMAGAVFGNLLGLPVWPAAFVTAITVSFLVGYLAERMRIDLNVSMAILFSLIMGIAFIGIGLTEGPKTQALGLIWGSLLLVSPGHVLWIGAACVVAGLFAALFSKELKAILFSRPIAASSGVRDGLVYYLLLLVSGFVITVNLEAVGGLMLFSLLVAPPAAACQLSRKYSNSVLLSVILGVAAAVGGLVLSYALDTPTGASIVVVAGGIFGASALLERKRRGAASRR